MANDGLNAENVQGHAHPVEIVQGHTHPVEAVLGHTHPLSMRIGLFTNNKIGFIDGTCKKENFEQNLHDQWERCNEFVLSWIMNVVTNELYSTVVYGSSACNVWRDLKERFDKKNISRIYNLSQEIIALKQGLTPVSVYYSKLKDLWDEYDAMTPTPSCPCPESRIFVEHI
ncbi:uncharacterized protein [Nicotiana sylvestris]|uniref:uncharacterized protein n=1 Tax=Nicotiana sylvestris TaxID=4096 RepID=UPI00388C7791